MDLRSVGFAERVVGVGPLDRFFSSHWRMPPAAGFSLERYVLGLSLEAIPRDADAGFRLGVVLLAERLSSH